MRSPRQFRPSSRKTPTTLAAPSHPCSGAPMVTHNIWHQAPWANREDLYIWKDDFSLVKGSHDLKFGGLFSHNFKDEPGVGGGGGNQQATIQGCGVQTGNCIADLLLKDTCSLITPRSRIPKLRKDAGATSSFMQTTPGSCTRA